MKRTGILSFILFFAILTGCEKLNPDPYTIKVENSFNETVLYDVNLYFYNSDQEHYKTEEIGNLNPGETSKDFEVSGSFLCAKVGAKYESDLSGDEIHRYTKDYIYKDGRETTIFVSPLQLTDPSL